MKMSLREFDDMVRAIYYARWPYDGHLLQHNPLGMVAVSLGFGTAEEVDDASPDYAQRVVDYYQERISNGEESLWAYEYGTWNDDGVEDNHDGSGACPCGNASCDGTNLNWAQRNGLERWYRAGQQLANDIIAIHGMLPTVQSTMKVVK